MKKRDEDINNDCNDIWWHLCDSLEISNDNHVNNGIPANDVCNGNTNDSANTVRIVLMPILISILIMMTMIITLAILTKNNYYND